MKISIVVPVFNEERYLKKFLGLMINDLDKLKIKYELIISENGSTDKTLAIARSIEKRFSQVRVITSDRSNYGLAVKNGFKSARGEKVVLFDLDYWDVDFLKRSLLELKNLDAVVASKNMPGSQDQRTIIRKFISRSFSLMLKILFALRISDTHGMKILDRSKFTGLFDKCIKEKEIFDSELLIRGQINGLKIGELPIQVQERRKSRSSILKRSILTLFDLMELKLSLMKINKVLIGLLLLSTFVLWPINNLPFSFIDDAYNLEAFDEFKTNRDLSWIIKEPDTGRIRPFYWISNFLQYELLGKDPYPHHLFRIFMGCTLVVLIYLLVSRITNSNMSGFLVASGSLFFYRTAENFFRLATQELQLLLLLLLSGYMLLRDKNKVLMSLFMILGLATKETGIFIFPLILLGWIVYPKLRSKLKLPLILSTLWIIVLVYLVFVNSQVNYTSNYTFNLVDSIEVLKLYGQFFDSAWVSSLTKISILIFMIRFFFDRKHLTTAFWSIAWMIFSLGILLPWGLVQGRYLLPVMPGLLLFFVDQTRYLFLKKHRLIILAPLAGLLVYYWVNFYFTNIVQFSNVLNGFIIRELAADEVAKYLSSNFYKTKITANFVDDPNYYEWVDGMERIIHHKYLNSTLEVAMPDSTIPAILVNWEYIPFAIKVGEGYNLDATFQRQTSYHNPLLENLVKSGRWNLYQRFENWEVLSVAE